MLFDDLLKAILVKLQESPPDTRPASDEEQEIVDEALELEASASKAEADLFLTEVAETAANLPDWIETGRFRLARDLRRAGQNFEGCILALSNLDELTRLGKKEKTPPTECGT